MAVCANRPDGGFGWYKGTATTCTEDTLFIILPNILLICAFLVCFALKKRMPLESRTTYPSTYGLQPLDSKSSVQPLSGTPINLNTQYGRRRMSIPHIGLLLLVAGVWIAAFAMQVVEIIRLSRGWLGIGLLYLCFPALALAILTLFVPTHATNAISRTPRPHSWGWFGSIVAWALAMCIVVGVKINTLVQVGAQFGQKVDATSKSKQPYYNDSRKLDCVAIIICYAASIPLYCLLTYLDRRRAAQM